jgi:hypothetical protein
MSLFLRDREQGTAEAQDRCSPPRLRRTALGAVENTGVTMYNKTIN